MLTQKVNKKKDQAMLALIVVIVIIVAIILLKNYVLKGGGAVVDNLLSGNNTSVDTNILREAPKSFQADVLQSEKYKSLIDNNIKIKEISELKVGNKKPFLAEAEKK